MWKTIQEHKEAILEALKVVPAGMGAAVGHIAQDITLAGIASAVTIVYGVVQTYISIQRYRRNR
jgi:hypothetical protein